MKTCPTCQRTFSDESLTFCLVDGAVLSAPYDPNQTQILPEPRTTDSPQQRNVPAQSTILAVNPQNVYAAQQPINRPEKRGSGPWIWIALASVFGVLVIGLVIGAFVWMSSNQADKQMNRNGRNGNLTVEGSPSPTPTVSDVVTWEEHPDTSINEGERITYYPGSTIEACKDDCRKISNCRAYTFIKAGAYNPGDSQMCYLMAEIKTLNPSSCCFTGVKK